MKMHVKKYLVLWKIIKKYYIYCPVLLLAFFCPKPLCVLLIRNQKLLWNWICPCEIAACTLIYWWPSVKSRLVYFLILRLEHQCDFNQWFCFNFNLGYDFTQSVLKIQRCRMFLKECFYVAWIYVETSIFT